MISTAEYAVQCRNVCVRYPSADLHALSDCSFSLNHGEHVALLGLNGSGKSTLLMAIAGLVKVSGEILVDGLLLSPSTLHDIRLKLGVLFATPEDQLLFPRIIDDVAFGLLRRGASKGDALREAGMALKMLGVSDLAEKEPYELSHGQRLRAALAGGLVTPPSLLLLDEATAALDPPGRMALGKLLQKTASAFLLATHDIDTAGRCCGRFLVLENGRIVRDTPSLDEVRPLIEPDDSD
jgi:energy-coupling factor transporter ATP-binding protein EcfA2